MLMRPGMGDAGDTPGPAYLSVKTFQVLRLSHWPAHPTPTPNTLLPSCFLHYRPE